eukprot:PLAT11559.1.p1 GENE.PLAT11559.1~~PLAT11559.1.p1  ORF type:complete len:2610 (+),score=1075.75 PLAT11559.1:1106-7831(+)
MNDRRFLDAGLDVFLWKRHRDPFHSDDEPGSKEVTDPLAAVKHRLRQQLRAGSASGTVDGAKLFRDLNRGKRAGSLKRSAFESALREQGISIPKKHMRQLIKSLDTDGDGSIDFDEFCNFIALSDLELSSIAARVVGLITSKRDHRAAFEAMDRNGDGRMSRSELRRVLRSIDVTLSESELERLFDSFDADDDGRINYQDLLSADVGGGGSGSGGSAVGGGGGSSGSRASRRARKPIYDLAVSENRKAEGILQRAGFEVIPTNLNDGTHGRKKMKLWLFRGVPKVDLGSTAGATGPALASDRSSKRRKLLPITGIALSRDSDSTLSAADGWARVEANLNKGRLSSKPLYLWFRRSESRCPLVDLAITVGDDRDRSSAVYQPPDSSFRRVHFFPRSATNTPAPANVNAGLRGSSVFLWMKLARGGSSSRLRAIRARMRRHFRRQARTASAFDFQRPWRRLQAHRTGVIGLSALEKVLATLNYHLSPLEEEELLQTMDKTGIGRLNFAQFCEFCGYGDTAVMRAVDKVTRSVGKGRRPLSRLEASFKAIDHDDDNTLMYDDFGQALDDAGVSLSKAEVATLCSRFDMRGDGFVSIQDFLHFLETRGEVDEGDDIDDAADDDDDGRVTFDMEDAGYGDYATPGYGDDDDEDNDDYLDGADADDADDLYSTGRRFGRSTSSRSSSSRFGRRGVGALEEDDYEDGDPIRFSSSGRRRRTTRRGQSLRSSRRGLARDGGDAWPVTDILLSCSRAEERRLEGDGLERVKPEVSHGVWMWLSRSPDEEPVTRVKLAQDSAHRKELRRHGYTLVGGESASSAVRKRATRLGIVMKREDSGSRPPLYAVAVTVGNPRRKSDRMFTPPSRGFTQVKGVIKLSSSGKEASALWTSTSPSSAAAAGSTLRDGRRRRRGGVGVDEEALVEAVLELQDAFGETAGPRRGGRRRDWTQAFEALEPDSSDRVPTAVIEELLLDMGMDAKLNDETITELMSLLDPDDRGYVKFDDFVAFCETDAEGLGGAPASRSQRRRRRRAADGHSSIDEGRNELRLLILDAAEGGGGKSDLRLAWEAFDRKGRGKVKLTAFRESLVELGFDEMLDSRRLSALVREFESPRKRGYADFSSFSRWVKTAAARNSRSSRAGRGRMQGTPVDRRMKRILRCFRSALMKRARRSGLSTRPDDMEMEEIFNMIDINHDGLVTMHELQGIVRKLRLQKDVRRQDLTLLMEYFDLNSDGFLDFTEFVLLMQHEEWEDDDLDVDDDEDGDDEDDDDISARARRRRRAGRSGLFVLDDDDIDEDEDEDDDDARFSSSSRRKRTKVGRSAFVGLKKKVQRAVSRLDLNNKSELVDWMASFDDDNSGTLTHAEFKRALRDLNVNLLKKDVNALVAFLDMDGDGAVDYDEFAQFAFAAKPVDVSRVSQKLRRLLKEAEMNGIDTRTAFEHFDRTGDGTVSNRDFSRAIKLMGLRLSKAEVDALLATFDLDGDGSVSYTEFLAFINKGDAKTETARHKIKEAVRLGKGDELLKKLQGYDLSGSGKISRRELLQALQTLHLGLSTRDLNKLVDQFDTDGDGSISYDEFWAFLKPEASTEDAELVFGKVQRFMVDAIGKGLRPADAFKREDPHGTGKVPRKAFRQALETLDVRLRDAEWLAVMDKFDASRDGNVDYMDFLRRAVPGGGGAGVLDSNLRLRLRELLYKWGGSVDLLRPFEALDFTGRGTVSRREFQTVLSQLGLALPAEDVMAIMERFHLTGDSRVSYRDFVKYASFSDSEMMLIAQKVRARLLALTSGGTDYRSSFELLDRDNTGFLPRRDFREAVRQLGLPLTESELAVILDRFRSIGDRDAVGYREFLTYVGSAAPASAMRAGTALWAPGGLGRSASAASLPLPAAGYDGLSSTMPPLLASAGTPSRRRFSRPLPRRLFGDDDDLARSRLMSSTDTMFDHSRASKSGIVDHSLLHTAEEKAARYRRNGLWECPVCYFQQTEPFRSKCAMCNCENPYDSTSHGLYWQCSSCTFENAAEAKECRMCGLKLRVALASPKPRRPLTASWNGSATAGPRLSRSMSAAEWSRRQPFPADDARASRSMRASDSWAAGDEWERRRPSRGRRRPSDDDWRRREDRGRRDVDDGDDYGGHRDAGGRRRWEDDRRERWRDRDGDRPVRDERERDRDRSRMHDRERPRTSEGRSSSTRRRRGDRSDWDEPRSPTGRSRSARRPRRPADRDDDWDRRGAGSGRSSSTRRSRGSSSRAARSTKW